MNTFNRVMSIIEDASSQKNFYPTPEHIADKLIEGIDWNFVESVLEPSAGKGDLAFIAAKKLYKKERSYIPYDERSTKEAIESADIDCVEIDAGLRTILEGRGFRVVCDDFLNYETQKRYSLVLMNPPFDKGADHLLHALELMQHGGEIRCILNAETIRNPYSETRKRLLAQLGDDVQITYMNGAFLDAERQSDVEIAIVKKSIPKREYDSTIMEEMRKAPTYKTQQISPEYSDIVKYNHIDQWVNRYNYEIACGIRLMEEWYAMQDLIPDTLTGNYPKPILTLKLCNAERNDKGANINRYMRMTRKKYWSALFASGEFFSALTSNLQTELRDSVNDMADYDFSAYNILTIIQRMNVRVMSGIEETIIALFDNWTANTWNEESPNRHYYNGWVTNKAYYIGKKVIIPFYGAYDSWSNEFRAFNVAQKMMDIEKVFDFLDNGLTEWRRNLSDALRLAEATKNTRNIDTKYFTVTFFKKGTCHLVFKNLDLLEKFNLFAGQRKSWLPPSYGKKHYADMSRREKEIIDSFQGEEAYERVVENAGYFLQSGRSTILAIESQHDVYQSSDQERRQCSND